MPRVQVTEMNALTTTALRVAVLAAGLVVVGCGTTTVNTKNAESILKQAVVAQTGVSIASVSCPTDVTAKKGATFACTAHGADGTQAPIAVRQTDDQGHVAYAADLVKQSFVQSTIYDFVQAKMRVAVNAVQCPAVLEYAVGRRFVCMVTSRNGSTAHATVKLEANGRFGFTVGR